MLQVEHLAKVYARGRGVSFTAVADVSFTIGRGECLALIGESGSGKTTIARMVSRLLQPSSGAIRFDGEPISAVSPWAFVRTPSRRLIQHVFQDPGEALTPHHTAFDAIAEPLRRMGRPADLAAQVRVLTAAVMLPAELLSRYPHQLSGGQKARIGIARALAPNPSLIVLDEPTASLDVSVQAGILKLLDEIRVTRGIAYLFVTHDLEVVRLISSKIVLMQQGRVMEAGPTAAFLTTPQSEYGRQLLAAIPRIGARHSPVRIGA
jgi:peptide/nickel transport system ATP-binding protein